MGFFSFNFALVLSIIYFISLAKCEPIGQGYKEKDKFKISSSIFKSTAEAVNELLTPWPSAPFISITTNELIVKVLVMIYPLMWLIVIIQTYLTFFGPSNTYVGYTGN